MARKGEFRSTSCSPRTQPSLAIGGAGQAGVSLCYRVLRVACQEFCLGENVVVATLSALYGTCNGDRRHRAVSPRRTRACPLCSNVLSLPVASIMGTLGELSDSLHVGRRPPGVVFPTQARRCR